MSNKADLLQARNEIMAVLDDKFRNVPEWKAFRAMDRALMAMDGHITLMGSDESPLPTSRKRSKLSYVDLALEAIRRSGKPVPISEIVAFIGSQRDVRNPDSIRVNIQSALSRDPRVQSIVWSGGRGWWFADREAPE
jgi:hypothetical protein